MANDNEELKIKIAKLETKIEELEKRLKENSENDEKRHREFLEQQKTRHNERMVWSKCGAVGGILTPIVGIIGVITWIIKMFKGNGGNKNDDRDLLNY